MPKSDSPSRSLPVGTRKPGTILRELSTLTRKWECGCFYAVRNDGTRIHDASCEQEEVSGLLSELRRSLASEQRKRGKR